MKTCKLMTWTLNQRIHWAITFDRSIAHKFKLRSARVWATYKEV